MSSSGCPCPAPNWQNEPVIGQGSLAPPEVETGFTGCPCPLCVTTNEAGQITGVYYTDQVDNVRKRVANCGSSSVSASDSSSSSSSDSSSASGSISVSASGSLSSSASRPSLSSVSIGGTGCCEGVPEYLIAEIVGGPAWLNGYYVLQNGLWPPAGPAYAGCWAMDFDTITTECAPPTVAEFSICCDGLGVWRFYSGANVLGTSTTPADFASCDPFVITWDITVTAGPCTGLTYTLIITAY